MFRQALICFIAVIAFSSCSLAQRTNPFQRDQRGRPQTGAQDGFNSLTGTVRSSDNKPLKDVRVELREAQTGSSVNSAYTTDRKSTRLNSSHTVISYAVFCLKKKIKH